MVKPGPALRSCVSLPHFQTVQAPSLLVLLLSISIFLPGLVTVTVSVNPGPRLTANGSFQASSSTLTVTASATPTAGRAPLNVSFTGSVSGGTPPYALFWDFGDGTTITGVSSVNHTYKNPGTFTAQFWAQDNATPPSKTFFPVTVNVFAVGGLIVTVLDPSGRPVANATVQTLSQPLGQYPLAGKTALNGSLNFGPLAAGTYTLKASAPGFENSTATRTVSPNTITLATMILAQAGPGLDPAALIAYIGAGAGATFILVLFFLRRRRSLGPATRPR